MCLPIDSCFGFGTLRTDDYRSHAPAATRTQPRPYNGNGYPAAAQGDRKASNYARRDPAHVVPAGGRGWNGHAATGAQEKAVAYAGETLKQQPPAPATWNGKVVVADGHGARGGAPHNYYYSNERAQPAPAPAPAPAHRDAAAADSYYPAATAASAHHESPSEALGGE